MRKICDMVGVRGYRQCTDETCELWFDDECKRLVLVAFNGDRETASIVDLLDIIEWSNGNGEILEIDHNCTI